MAYSKKIYELSLSKLADRKRQAEFEAEERKNRFLEQHPEGRVLLNNIGKSGSLAAKAVLSGANAKDELLKLRDVNLRLQQQFTMLLAENGLTRGDIEAKYNCPKCSDTGYVNGKMCSCLKELMRSTAYEQLCNRTPLKISSFESFNLKYYDCLDEKQRGIMCKTFEYCRNYANNFNIHCDSLIFQGGTGLGKTHLALAIAGVAIQKGFGVIYGTAQNFAVALERERFDDEDAESTSAMLSDCDLLILDDLGTEFSSSYVTAALYSVIDTRLMKGLPIIITTNLQPQELQKRYSERLVSRLFGCCIRLNFYGKDIRQYRD